MKRLTKLQQQEQQQSAEHKQEVKQATAAEFATVEEMLRHDASNTPVPPGVARRLRETVQKSPSKKPWWKRLVR